MKRLTLLGLALALVVIVGVNTDSALAQYTGEFVFCVDGSSPAACRGSALTADPNTGVTTWDRAVYGATVCAGVGLVAQGGDCTLSGASYLGHGCSGVVLNIFTAVVPAGVDMAIACSDTTLLPAGNYSANATGSSDCADAFPGASGCGNLTIVN